MSAPHDDFFVGYKPMSRATGRATLYAGILALAITAFVAAALAAGQRRDGDGIRSIAPGGPFVGLFSPVPYPHIVHFDQSGSPATLLMVSGAKGGFAAEGLREHMIVEVSGTVIERDGTRLLEAPSVVEAANPDPTLTARLRALKPQDLGVVELRGEIVDSKCYFGRMRPGGGRTHRACAQLCISGGIPPVLVVREKDGREIHFLVTTAANGRANDFVLDYVSEPVSIRGRARLFAGLRIIAADVDGIERL